MAKKVLSVLGILLGGVCLLVFQPNLGFSEGGSGQETILGAPIYPGWTLNRKDDLKDKNSGAHWFQNQYFSDDTAEKIVGYYETSTGKKGYLAESTHTYAITTSDGVVINIMGPPQGVEQRDHTNTKVLKIWKTLISIIKVEQPKK
ncbi:MAG TPA: hypothetical protein VGB26_04880 [Nitrospiria bacterium]|jgi:hypothetical protein